MEVLFDLEKKAEYKKKNGYSNSQVLVLYMVVQFRII